MARARNLKPGFFRDAALVELPVETRLLFPGLWTLADRQGKLEDKPKQIKMEIYPADSFDVESMLEQLSVANLIIRYSIDGKRFIKIRNFKKHQNPHRDERESEIPEPCESIESTVQAPCEHGGNRASTSNLTPDSLNLTPSTLIPDSLIPESDQPKSKPLQPAAPAAPKKKVADVESLELQAVCRETWGRYSEAYAQRYGTPPVRNAKINGQVKQFCRRVPACEAPAIAAFYVTHNNAFYVGKGHAVGQLLADAEKLRTEWATNRTMTQSEARQADETQGRGNVWGEIIAEAKERERNEAIQQAQ